MQKVPHFLSLAPFLFSRLLTHKHILTHYLTQSHTHTHTLWCSSSWIKEQSWSRGKKLFRQICCLTEDWEGGKTNGERKREEYGEEKRKEGRDDRENKRKENNEAFNKVSTDLTWRWSKNSWCNLVCVSCSLSSLLFVWIYTSNSFCACVTCVKVHVCDHSSFYVVV